MRHNAEPTIIVVILASTEIAVLSTPGYEWERTHALTVVSDIPCQFLHLPLIWIYRVLDDPEPPVAVEILAHFEGFSGLSTGRSCDEKKKN
jgi:hypothetical protein